MAADGSPTYFAYDVLGRQVAVTDALGSSTYYQYDLAGQQAAQADALGHVTYFYYDVLGRQQAVRDAADGLVYYGYDALGRRAALVDQRGYASYFAYDALSRLASEKDPLGSAEYYAYDAASNILSRTAADGLSVYYAHDVVSRLVSTLYPDGYYTYFEYDLGSNLTAACDERGWSCFTHDALSRLTGETYPDGLEVSHAYGAGGERTALTVSATGTAYYAYDPVGRMVSAQAASPEVGTAYYQYRPDGLLAKKTLANGCYTYFAYDPARRLTQLLNCFPDGRPLVYFEYGYDAGSRITSVRREDGNVIYYGYDVVNRLTSEGWYDSGMNQLYAFQWDYDPAGNRTYERRGDVETYYTYDEANEVLQARKLPADEWTYFQYDLRGNTVAIQEPDGTTYFQYNGVNLVTAIAYKTGVANYFYYDPQMRRYAIEESAGLSYFTWDANGMNLLSERDAGGDLTADYAHGYTPISGIGSMTAARKPLGETTYYQYPIYNHRGDVLRLLDEAANVTSAYEYDAWGVPLHSEESGTPNRFRYQANWIALADSGGALLLSPARLYEPNMSRFLGTDAGSNRSYRFAKTCPVSRADPDGAASRKVGVPADIPTGWSKETCERLDEGLLQTAYCVLELLGYAQHPVYAFGRGRGPDARGEWRSMRVPVLTCARLHEEDPAVQGQAWFRNEDNPYDYVIVSSALTAKPCEDMANVVAKMMHEWAHIYYDSRQGFFEPLMRWLEDEILRKATGFLRTVGHVSCCPQGERWAVSLWKLALWRCGLRCPFCLEGNWMVGFVLEDPTVENEFVDALAFAVANESWRCLFRAPEETYFVPADEPVYMTPYTDLRRW